MTKLLWELKEDENVVKYCCEMDSMHKVRYCCEMHSMHKVSGPGYAKGSLGLIFVNECLFDICERMLVCYA